MSRLRPLLKNALFYIKDKVCWVLCKKCFIRIRYFSAKPNVGDTLNLYIASAISKKGVFEVKSNACPHILGIGSIMHLASSNSFVWGSGIIDPKVLPDEKIIRSLKVIALRGENTKYLLKKSGASVEGCLLGDPALLMPLLYKPSVVKKYEVGIIPHYVDKENKVVIRLSNLPNVTVLNVEDPPEIFICRLKECERIISSSLHGLILSDAYNIPNSWVSFSNNVIGGSFKFLDYYTTTENHNPKVFDFKNEINIEKCFNDSVFNAKLNNYLFDKSKLIDSFPMSL